MTGKERDELIDRIFEVQMNSVFSEGCEEKIAAGLEARTDEQLLKLADKYDLPASLSSRK